MLSALESQGTLGQIVGRILDIGWSLVTFLAVPVIAIEGTGPLRDAEALLDPVQVSLGSADHRQHRDRRHRRSGADAAGGADGRHRRLLWSSSGPAGAVLILIGVIVFLIGMIIQKAMGGIFGVALYHYAAEGEAMGGFTAAELDSAVKQKSGSTGPTPQPA